MRRLCTYPGCNTPVEVDPFDRSSPRCPLHPSTHVPKQRYAHHYHDGKNIYYSNRWKKLRQAYIEHQPLCEHCLKLDLITPASVVDHIKEIKDGGEAWSFDNLQSLCSTCHNRKTAIERRRRNKGNGFGSVNDF